MPSSRKQSLLHQIFTLNFVSVLDFPRSTTYPTHFTSLTLNTHIISLPRVGQTLQPVPVYRTKRNSSTTSPQHDSLFKKKRSILLYSTCLVLFNFQETRHRQMVQIIECQGRCQCAALHSLEHALTCWHRPLPQMLELLP
jgi:hypothetical protein